MLQHEQLLLCMSLYWMSTYAADASLPTERRGATQQRYSKISSFATCFALRFTLPTPLYISSLLPTPVPFLTS